MNAAEVRMNLSIILEAQHMLAGQILAGLAAQHAALDGIRKLGQNPGLDRPIRAIVAGENPLDHMGHEVWAVLQSDGGSGTLRLEARHLDVLRVAVAFDLETGGVPIPTAPEKEDALQLVIAMVRIFGDDVLDLRPILAKLQAQWAEMNHVVQSAR